MKYNVHKESPIDFLIAGVRGTLAGATTGIQIADQRKQIERENQFKIAQLQQSKGQFDQDMAMRKVELQARQGELLSTQTFTASQAALNRNFQEEQSLLELAQVASTSVTNKAIADQTERARLMIDVYNTQATLKVREKEAEVQSGILAANLGLREKQFSQGVKEAGVQSGFREKQFSQGVGEEAFNQKIEKTKLQMDIVELQRKLATEKAATAPQAMRTLEAKYTSIAQASGSQPADRSLASRLSIARAVAEYAQNKTTTMPVYIFINRKMAQDVNTTMTYEAYLDMISTGTTPDNIPLEDNELAQIRVMQVPAQLEKELDTELQKDVGVQSLTQQIQDLSDFVKTMGPTVAVPIKPTQEPIQKIISKPTPEPIQKIISKPTTKPIQKIISKTPKQGVAKPTVALPMTWGTFIASVSRMPNKAAQLKFLRDNKFIINSKYSQPAIIQSMIDELESAINSEQDQIIKSEVHKRLSTAPMYGGRW